MSTYRTAVITGASRGIGAATARALTERGMKVIAIGRSAPALEALKSEIDCTVLPLDIADMNAVMEALKDVEADVVVNNAGTMTQAAPFAELDLLELQQSVDVNLKGTLAVTRALLPGMIERRRGHLFFITSMIGPNAAPNASVYAATKAGVRALASCLRLELAGKRVRVTEIAPGRVHTTFFGPSFKGDMEAVEKTLFDEYDALEPADVATALTGALDLPEHADISRIEITSTDQALGGMTYAKRAS
jgi:3-hydroxy acid dehydrogenase/malonic semialdehyde reductase